MYKILLVTPGLPSLNPRLVKEADTLATAGYNVTVIYSYWNNWGYEFNKTLLLKKNWDAKCIGGDPVNSPKVYFVSRLIHKITKWLYYKLHLNFFAELAAARTSYLLIREVKKHKADLYIAHNLGALPAVVKAAKKYNAKCGFDAEDFHRQEVSDNRSSFNFKISEYLESKYLTKLDYLTTSSPQITLAYRQIYRDLNPTTILNVFSNSSLTDKQNFNDSDRPLKLFWFSQTIGANRGIDDIINALELLNTDHFELHLLGNKSTDNFINKINRSDITIKFHDPIPSHRLTDFAAQFDIGLALEPGFSLNNNIALSNKIFTYMQAGLAIIASDTIAQQDFMNKNPKTGSIYSKEDSKELAAILLNYYQNRDELTSCKNAALHLAHYQYNWEIEGIKFLEVVKHSLSDNIQ